MTHDSNALEDLLRRQIAAHGPISIADFMGLALTHPQHGYYSTRDPFGTDGDFITAPEVSQMFGELIGLWAAQTWIERNRPTPVTLMELGPGRGTLMSDALRALAVVPDLRAALTVRLVETSPALRQRQTATLQDIDDIALEWHASAASALEATNGFVLILANEFFDALPIRQFVRGQKGWHERMVGLGEDDTLTFVVAPDPVPLSVIDDENPLPDGTIREWGRASEQTLLTIAEDLKGRPEGGAILIVDYGHTHSGPGETLQAVRQHAHHPVLEAPGTADLTAHVDFETLIRTAQSAGAAAHGPVTQGAFLQALGIETRAAALTQGATPEQQEAIGSALTRLTHPDAMGTLFKVLAISDPEAPPPPVFGQGPEADAMPPTTEPVR